MKMIFLLFQMLTLLSCKSNDDRLFIFDPRGLKENNISLSFMADDISYIPLDNSIKVGPVHHNFKFTGDAIYFSVTYEGIMKFDRSGNFERKIGGIGRGPSEYNVYRDFSVDPEGSLVYVRNNSNGPAKVYSDKGIFIKDIVLEEGFGGIGITEFFDSKLILFYEVLYNKSKYNWIAFDTLGKAIKKKELTIPEVNSGWFGSSGTYRFKNNLYYWDTYNDTVFSISPDLTCKASFIISPGEHRAPSAPIPDPNLLKKYMLINGISETNRFIIIEYFYKDPFLMIYDKENKIVFQNKMGTIYNGKESQRIGGIFNDLDGGMNFQPYYYFVENNREYLIGLINPYDIKAQVQKDEFKNFQAKYPEKKKAFEELAGRINETDNQVLMVVRLKQ
ncbi:MAG: 6-bladed beta-propeller [Bacteroidales bacterium]|nr:6-bladed beta-propeller [Bacteroidales bacterium]